MPRPIGFPHYNFLFSIHEKLIEKKKTDQTKATLMILKRLKQKMIPLHFVLFKQFIVTKMKRERFTPNTKKMRALE